MVVSCCMSLLKTDDADLVGWIFILFVCLFVRRSPILIQPFDLNPLPQRSREEMCLLTHSGGWRQREIGEGEEGKGERMGDERRGEEGEERRQGRG